LVYYCYYVLFIAFFYQSVTALATVHVMEYNNKLKQVTKKGDMKDFFCEIEVFRQENGHIRYIRVIYGIYWNRDRQKTALKWKLFAKKGHSKI